MMSDAQISVGDLTSFLLYTGFVGISVAGTELSKGEGWLLLKKTYRCSKFGAVRKAKIMICALVTQEMHLSKLLFPRTRAACCAKNRLD